MNYIHVISPVYKQYAEKNNQFFLHFEYIIMAKFITFISIELISCFLKKLFFIYCFQNPGFRFE